MVKHLDSGLKHSWQGKHREDLGRKRCVKGWKGVDETSGKTGKS